MSTVSLRLEDVLWFVSTECFLLPHGRPVKDTETNNNYVMFWLLFTSDNMLFVPPNKQCGSKAVWIMDTTQHASLYNTVDIIKQYLGLFDFMV